MNLSRRLLFAVSAAVIALAIAPTRAQDRLRAMPGYDQFTKMQQAMAGGPAVVSGAVSPTWAPDGSSFTYNSAGKSYRFDVATMQATAMDAPPAAAAPAGPGNRGAGTRAGGQGQGGQTPPTAPGRAGGMQQAQTEVAGVVVGCPNVGAARGRQADCSASPDGKLKAFYRDRNLWVANFDGTNEKKVTTDGSIERRIKNGSGSWVYGEELSQTTAIWWSPNSTKVGYYRFDESQVKDYYLQMNQGAVQDTLDVEAYPKSGAPNPIAEVWVYDVAAGTRKQVDVRDGQPFTNDVVGHYAYNVRWSPDGTELFLNRTNRRQQIMEFVACAPATGKCRVVVREEWKTGWVDNRPSLTYLRDQKRFIWESERSGFANYYLGDVTGKPLTPITSMTTAEVSGIVKIDEAAGVLFYMARDGERWMKPQLHRVGLNGQGDVRLTDPKYAHSISGGCNAAGGGGGRGGDLEVFSGPDADPQRGGGAGGGGGGCGISADNKYFVDVYQTHDEPPATQLVDASTGKVMAQIAKSDLTKFNSLGLKKAEQFTYMSADGKTKLFGQIQFPSNFDPAKKYPTLISVYGGPASGSNVPTENFVTPGQGGGGPIGEYGFLLVNLSSRSAPGQGRRVLDQVYMNLGIVEMDDMAEGIKSLWPRPYFDKLRVGMYGTSYGGYTSAAMILRHPEAVTVASAGSPVTSWYHYDSIYTERYMWIPQENKGAPGATPSGYEGGNLNNYAKDLRGRLLIYYGTADNNVHPNNSMQLIQALQRAGKSFEVQVGPDQGHSSPNNGRMMEFLIENLVIHPERILAPGAGGSGGA